MIHSIPVQSSYSKNNVMCASKPHHRLFIVGAVLAMATLSVTSAWARTWTDSTGEYQVEAEYAGLSDGVVKLKKPDGNLIEVPLERLSESDRAYVKQQQPSDGDSPAESAGEELQTKLTLTFDEPFAVHAPRDQEPLFATIELAGTAAAQATHFGFLDVSTAKADGDETLEQIESSFSMNNPVEQFVEVDRQMMFAGQFDRPDDELRIQLMLQRPPSAAKRLQVLEGSLQLMTGGERKQVTVEGIAEKVGEALSDPVLEEAGLEVQVTDPADAQVTLPDAKPEQMIAVNIQGPETAILDMDLVDAEGNELETMAAWSGGPDGTLSYTLQAEDGLPPNVGFRWSLAVDQQRVRVPFRFEDVPLPSGEDSTTADAVPGSGKIRQVSADQDD